MARRRAPDVPALAGFGLLATLLPWLFAKRVALCLTTLVVAIAYIGRTFNITLYNVEMLLPFLSEVRPLRSPEYLAGGAVVLVSVALVWRYAPRVPAPGSVMSWLLATLALLALINFDDAATAGTAGSYLGLPEPGTPFDSAVRESGLDRPPRDGRHVIVILVEALGMPASPAEKALFDADWNRPAWKARYDVRHGSVPYFGSTTNGELRELCGVWAAVDSFDLGRADCLPKRFRRAGYATAALHGFTSSFFDRERWWPQVGFERRIFGPELLRLGASGCGGVFPGACDQDVPRLIWRQLKAAKRPQFLYWVTLNTHLPILADRSLGTDDCRFGYAELGDEAPMVCRLFLLHHRLADAISRMAMDPAMPPADILIVGDHMPPFFQRTARIRFDGQRVPWILLRAKDAAVFTSEAARR